MQQYVRLENGQVVALNGVAPLPPPEFFQPAPGIPTGVTALAGGMAILGAITTVAVVYLIVKAVRK